MCNGFLFVIAAWLILCNRDGDDRNSGCNNWGWNRRSCGCGNSDSDYDTRNDNGNCVRVVRNNGCNCQ